MAQFAVLGWGATTNGRLNGFELAALERCVLATKSIILSSRLIMEYTDPEKCQSGPRYGVESIAQRASLEVRFQTQMWGEVEDSMSPSFLSSLIFPPSLRPHSLS